MTNCFCVTLSRLVLLLTALLCKVQPAYLHTAAARQLASGFGLEVSPSTLCS